MESKNLFNQQNNIMIPNPMNTNMYNNDMMQNLMNNIIYNNTMMLNPMNNIMYNNDMMLNPMNNIIYNNDMMQNPMNNLTNNYMIQNHMNNLMNNCMTQIPNNNININNNNKINNKENIPIENSTVIELDNNETIKYYLYPKIEFTEEEKKSSKVLLVLGQTGHGKTTFINALINIYLGITINDKFRYLSVKPEKNQLNSQTKEITIYKVRPKKGLNFPPLIIVDTPGFCDTEGKDKDKENAEKFQEFFGSKEIKNINCILYIIVGANSRFGEIDKYIINNLLNLFSRNVKENFVVGVTNFTPHNKEDIPNIINSLSHENHFYYQNVLKNDELSREQVINSYWYFASDNKIILDNKIERNELEKVKWKLTEKEIIKFLENKIKILDAKNLLDSQKVLNNRFQLENEIISFTEKINVLILKKKVYEDNLRKANEYREIIIAIRNKIDKNKLEKKNILQTLKEIRNALPYMKAIKSGKIKTEKENLICELCELNCHKNCDCVINTWFCSMISFSGECKICNHSFRVHKKEKFIYIYNLENEPLLYNENNRELDYYINFLSNTQKEEELHLNALNEYDNILKNTLNYLYTQIRICNAEIEGVERQNLSVENEIIEVLKIIKINLDFLRSNALNKETRTIKIFIEEFIINKDEKEKEIINNLFQKYQNHYLN